MHSGGSSAFHFAPAAEYNFAPSQFAGQIHEDEDQQQLPAFPDYRRWGYTSNDNYLVQDAQFVTSTPDSGPVHPHLQPQSPAVAGAARPSNPARVGFVHHSTHQQLNQPFNYGLVAPPHRDHTSYYSGAYNNSPAWFPDGEARIDDGSSSSVSSPASLALSSPPASAAKQEKPHKCDLCPAGKSRFASARDLQRHRDTSHKNEETRMYVCWCGGRGHQTPRKDNHLRHVQSCNRQLYPDYYTCICGLGSRGKHVHLTHVQNCGRTRTVRPRSTRTPGAP
ncbi:hypothetical protein LA080_013737 [Diaporthe eres]|nr:hypothetical protein LA080_013737 [Diaporthe eres]